MKIVGMTDGNQRVLLFYTDRNSSSQQQRALFLSRSVTMLGEYYLMDGQPVDAEGKQIPIDDVHRDALRGFLSDGQSRWRQFNVPDLNTLLSLD